MAMLAREKSVLSSGMCQTPTSCTGVRIVHPPSSLVFSLVKRGTGGIEKRKRGERARVPIRSHWLYPIAQKSRFSRVSKTQILSWYALSLGRPSTSLLRTEGKKERWSCASRIKPRLSGLCEQKEHRGLKSFLKFWRQEETQLSHYPPADKYLKATIKKTQPCIPCYLPGSHGSTMGATFRQTATQGAWMYQVHRHRSLPISAEHYCFI